MVITRSRSQGSPQVRDVEEVEKSRKRGRNERVSPLRVKKRLQDKQEHTAASQAEASRPIRHKISSGLASDASANVYGEAADEPESLGLALRQREAAEDKQSSKAHAERTQRSKHVRFGSEDPANINLKAMQDVSTGIEQPIQQVVAVNEGHTTSDEDDSPEAITTATSQAQARVLAEGAARAIRSKQKTEKELRKQRDSKFKQQAQESSARRKGAGTDAIPGEKPILRTDELAQQLLQTGQMPDFLPVEILDQKPDLAPPQFVDKQVASKHRKNLNTKSQRPMDLVRQGRVVKILDQASSIHPPPANASSKSLRERWLAGQKRNDNSVAASRKPFAKRFVTR